MTQMQVESGVLDALVIGHEAESELARLVKEQVELMLDQMEQQQTRKEGE